MKNPVDIENIFDVTDGMGYYIYESAKKCKNPNRFTDDLSSKSFTTSRLKRAILYAILNLKSFDKSPKYTTLLAVNDKGKALIKQNRKKENIVILTKHSDASKLDEKSKMPYLKFTKRSRIENHFTTTLIKSFVIEDEKTPIRSVKRITAIEPIAAMN